MEGPFMRQLLIRFGRDECGALLATDWVFTATILVLGFTVGLATVRQTVHHELDTLACSLGALSQPNDSAGPGGHCSP
jgi:hypothetical protein